MISFSAILFTARARTLAFSLCAASALPFAAPHASGQATLTVLHAINQTGDPKYPGDLIQGNDGNFYGVASGGANGNGAIIKVTPAGVLTTLHDFSAYASSSSYVNADGANPVGRLIQGADGNFYGATVGGGAHGEGVFFKITPAGVLTDLYDFYFDASANVYSGTSGGPLALGSDGNFYGAGNGSGIGALFKLTPAGVFTLLHTFSTGTYSGGVLYLNSDGSNPSELVQGTDGNLYGTASGGGVNGTGTIFKVTPSGAFSLLRTNAAASSQQGYDFGPNDGGAAPYGALALGHDGNLYGTMSDGGAHSVGTVFRITPDGVFTTLHDFSALGAHSSNSDGAYPQGRLLVASDGNLYGTTSDGGNNNGHGNGTVFKITPDAVLTSLYSFSPTDQPGDYGVTNNDGTDPTGGLVQGTDGSFYGSTTSGGVYNLGTIFKVTLGNAPVSPFFNGETALSNGVYYLQFSSGNPFGYYSYLTDPHYIYHFDLGYEYVFDAADGHAGVYLYDFKSNGFFYTSPSFPFPYLYDFSLNTVLYYFPDPNNPGHYNTNGVRYFVRLDNGQIFSK